MPGKRTEIQNPEKAVTRGTDRPSLNHERVLKAAVKLADKHGVEALTMRRLGSELHVEAMSLYNHVANKEELLDGLVDAVAGAVGMPDPDAHWRASLRQRTIEMYQMLLRHPWAAPLMESRRNPIASRMKACDATIGVFRKAGFSVRAASRAFLTLDSYLYGFVLQQSNWSFTKADLGDFYHEIAPMLPESEFPNIVEMIRFLIEDPQTSVEATQSAQEMYLAEFEWGLDLLLDGLERTRDEA